MRERIKSGIIIASLFLLLAAFSWNRATLRIILALLSVISVYEILSVTDRVKSPVSMIWGGICAICIPLLFNGFSTKTGTALLFVGTASMMGICAILLKYRHKKFATPMLAAILSIIVPLFFTTIALLRQMPYGAYLFYAVFLCSWGTDTAGYFFGYFFGKRKMTPRISPKKTFEGAIGGLITSAGAFAIIGFATYIEMGIHINYFITTLIGVICGIVSICGDLSASILKRCYGAKDFGHLIPGHGGIMDRFDSVLFTAPAIYFSAVLLETFNLHILG